MTAHAKEGTDLTDQEQQHVRTAIKFLRIRSGTYESLARVLKFRSQTIRHSADGDLVSASLAFRIARLADVTVDDLLKGKFPPKGTCAHCGYNPKEGLNNAPKLTGGRRPAARRKKFEPEPRES